MSNARVDAFHELTALLDRLEKSSQQVLAGTRNLAAVVRERDAEYLATHSASLSNAGALIEQSQAVRSEIVDSQGRVRESFQAYTAEVTNSANMFVRELDGPRGQLEDFGSTISNKLEDQYQGMHELGAADSQAHRARTKDLNDFDRDFEESGDTVRAIGTFLAEANGALAIATHLDDLTELQQAELQALIDNQEAVIAFNHGSRLSALISLHEAVQLAPGLGGIWLNLARAYLAHHDLDAASQALSEASRLAPDVFGTIYTKGLYVLQKGDASAAIALLEHSASHAPTPLDEAEVRLALADAHFRNGQPLAALAQWCRVTEIDPMNLTARTYLEFLE